MEGVGSSMICNQHWISQHFTRNSIIAIITLQYSYIITCLLFPIACELPEGMITFLVSLLSLAGSMRLAQSRRLDTCL